MKHSAVILLVVAVLFVVGTYAEDCKQGETKKEDCNTCNCVNGLWACTRKHCIKTRATMCRPGETFQRQCNTCTCSADGMNAACTYKICV